MATFDLPAALQPQVMSFALEQAGLQFRSPFNGRLQAVNFVAERWKASLTTVPVGEADSAAMDVLANQLAGGLNRVRLGHPTRLTPRGTLRGAPVLRALAVRGDAVLQLAECRTATGEPGGTLRAGDLLGDGDGKGEGTHLWQVAADCEADGGGLLDVPLVNRVRRLLPAGTAIQWNRPKVAFVAPSMINWVVYRPGHSEGLPLDLEERWD